MKKINFFIVRTIVLFFFWTPLVPATSSFSDSLSIPDLILALQSGGHIIYMRHSVTNHTQKDVDRNNLDDCSGQRNLDEEGRQQAKGIGHTMKMLQIPIGNVFSSPYCRCRDTAQLTFGKYQIEPDLLFSISKDKEESRQLGQHLYNMMINSEVNQNNTVFVGHSSNLRDGLGVWPKPEGVIVIFQNRDNKLIYKGMIRPDQWLELKIDSKKIN